MTSSFTVNVSGGNVSIGALSQGDKSSVQGNSTMTVTIEAAAEQLYAALPEIAQRSGASPEALDTVRTKAKELVDAASKQQAAKGASVLEFMQKNFSWAYPALKDFAKVAWPALLVAIGA